jgi:hypothetical protein
MPGFDYARMQGTASRLLNRFAQGTVTLTKPGETVPGANPWDPPVEGEPTEVTYTLDATVKGVSDTYIDGTIILATDLEVTASTMARDASGAQVAIDPDFGTDTLSIDGQAVSLVRNISVPAAGTRVVLKYIVRG